MPISLSNKMLSMNCSPNDIVRYSFLDSINVDSLSLISDITITNIDLFEFLGKLKLVTEEITNTFNLIRGLSSFEYILESEAPAILIEILLTNNPDNIESKNKNSITLNIHGEGTYVRELKKKIDEVFNEKLSKIQWWYECGGGNFNYSNIILNEVNTPCDEFYPWIKEGINAYLNNYLNNKASLLFLTGPPGTGKTSLLRHFLCSNKLNAMITYDSKALECDYLFMQFITSPTHNVLVIEDSDLMISSRENTGNTLIHRFLNVSDGMIKFDNKKIIFTSNLENYQDIDQALIRPGRCFGTMVFRKLTHKETVIAAKVANLPVPTGKENISLAELFNQNYCKVEQHRKIGFHD